jgi:hypothetical protein
MGMKIASFIIVANSDSNQQMCPRINDDNLKWSEKKKAGLGGSTVTGIWTVIKVEIRRMAAIEYAFSHLILSKRWEVIMVSEGPRMDRVFRR